MKRNDYRQQAIDPLQRVRASQGTAGYQAVVDHLEAEIEVLKDEIDSVPDERKVSHGNMIGYLKRMVSEIKSEPRKRDEVQKTGAYTD